jgi:aldose 1-epimerase
MSLQLKSDRLEMGLLPDLGGATTYLRLDGQDVLRPAPENVSSPLDCAAFPLVPFPGRIDNAVFRFDDRTHVLPKNFPPEPHAIHGFGWQTPWRVETETENCAEMVHTHAGDVWPWPYTARQTFSLDALTMTLEMSVTNTGQTPMPAGLGWHPYFPSEGAEIQASVSGIWHGHGAGGPVKLVEGEDLRLPRPAQDLALDHAFSSSACQTGINWPDKNLAITMDSAPARHLVVYTPKGKPHFCVEPLTQTPNAVNMGLPEEITGLQTLPPGETTSLVVTLRLSESAS